MRMAVVTLCALVLVGAPLHYEWTTARSEAMADPQASAIATTINQLRVHPASGAVVPPEVRTLLGRLKTQIRELVINEISLAPTSVTPDPAIVTASVKSRLTAVNIIVGEVPASAMPSPSPDTDMQPYQKPAFGHIEQLSLARSSKNQSVLLLSTRLGLPCGSDSSLSGLSLDNGAWTIAFIREKNNYASITDALGELQSDISGPDQHGSFLLVSTAGPPSCSSTPPTTNMIELSALKVTTQPKRSVELFSDSDEQRKQRVFAHQSEFTLSPDSFVITLQGEKFLERGQASRKRALHFKVEGSSLREISPSISDSFGVLDFVDEWASLSWNRAANLVSGIAKSLIKCRHEMINAEGVNGPVHPQVLGQAVGCQDGQMIVILGLSNRSTLFLTIDTATGSASITGVNTTRPICIP